jgi:hypothetical protein
VLVAIILAAAVIIGGVIVVAMGRGGELARERPDAPASADFRTWSDVAQYRPPAALLGYHARATEHALSLIARTIAERDAEIEWLRQRLVEVRPGLRPYSSDVIGSTSADEAGSASADEAGSASPDEAASAGLDAGARTGTDDPDLGAPAGLAHDAMRAEQSVGGRIGEDE